jgi:hypothetical protein
VTEQAVYLYDLELIASGKVQYSNKNLRVYSMTISAADLIMVISLVTEIVIAFEQNIKPTE